MFYQLGLQMCSDFLKNLVFNRRAHVASNVTVAFLGPEFTIIYVIFHYSGIIYYYCGGNNVIKMFPKYFFRRPNNLCAF